MKYTLVSGCSTSLDIDTLALTTTDVKYIEKELNYPTLAQVFDGIYHIGQHVPRPTTSYVILNIIAEDNVTETDYLLVGRAVGDDTIMLTNKALYKRETTTLTLVDGSRLDVATIDGLST